MFRTAILCYPWDLLDEGVERVLDFIQGELGASEIIVPFATGAIAELRPHAAAEPHLFRTTGGLHYQSRAEFYESTRCKPLPAEPHRSSGRLENLAEQCRERSLALGVRVSTTEIGRLAAKHPEFASTDAFGERSLSRLCPGNGDVAELFGCVAREAIERFRPAFIELSGLFETPGTSLEPGFDVQRRLGKIGSAWIGLCFCESCRQAGGRNGFDMAAVQQAVTSCLTQALQCGEPVEQSSVSSEFLESIRDVEDHRYNAQLDLESAIRESSACPVWVRLWADEFLDGKVFARNGPTVCAFTRFSSIDSLDEAVVKRALKLTSGPLRFELPIYDPDRPDGAWLVRTLHRLAAAGLPSVSLSHHGQVPVAHFPGLKQAIRFARRI